MKEHDLDSFTDVRELFNNSDVHSSPLSLEACKAVSQSNINDKTHETLRGIDQRGEFRSLNEIAPRYRNVFSFPYFNVVQSKIIDDALYTDKSLVVCAPTGSGKTVIFEMAIVRLLIQLEKEKYDGDFKIVYIAPVKALCTEKLTEWYPKFTPLGLHCREVTGDTDIEFHQLKPYKIILTTPEKWNMLTRKWTGHKELVQAIRLFMLDEVHILNDDARGHVLEAVVSRMKTIQVSMKSEYRMSKLQQRICPAAGAVAIEPQIRFVAVSATIANPEDVAAWLSSEDNQAVYYSIGEECRPVKIKKIVEGYPCTEGTGIFKFDLNLNYKLKDIIQKHSNGKPTLIFCSTRKSALLTAQALVNQMTFHFSEEQRNKLAQLACMIKDKKLQALVLNGIGCHHAGYLHDERHVIENAFRNRLLPILVTTTTLAMGVNLPAHLVIVKSTKQYINGMYQEYSMSTILQMMGRAGRPQFDTEATAVIMTRMQDKHRYTQLVLGSGPLESSLHRRLAEHLNSEVALGAVTEMAEAVEWARSTFLYVRAAKNPAKYLNMPYGKCTREQVEKKIEDLCVKAMNGLVHSGMINMDQATGVTSTPAGLLMASNCLDFITMKLIMKIQGNETLPDLLNLVCECQELADMHLRVEERTALNKLNRNRDGASIRFPFKGKVNSRQIKLSCLIQATLGCLNIPDPSLGQECIKVMRIAERVARSMLTYLTRPDWLSTQPPFYKATLNAVLLLKCLIAKLWEDSKYVCRLLRGIGPVLGNMLVSSGKTTFAAIANSNPRDLERIINKSAPAGNVLIKQVMLLPKYGIELFQLEDGSMSVEICLKNLQTLQANSTDLTAGENHKFHVIVGDSNNNLLYTDSFSDRNIFMAEDNIVSVTFKPKDTYAEKIYVHCISASIVGIDEEASINIGEPNFTQMTENAGTQRDDKKRKKQTKITDSFNKRKKRNTPPETPNKPNVIDLTKDFLKSRQTPRVGDGKINLAKVGTLFTKEKLINNSNNLTNETKASESRDNEVEIDVTRNELEDFDTILQQVDLEMNIQPNAEIRPNKFKEISGNKTEPLRVDDSDDDVIMNSPVKSKDYIATQNVKKSRFDPPWKRSTQRSNRNPDPYTKFRDLKDSIDIEKVKTREENTSLDKDVKRILNNYINQASANLNKTYNCLGSLFECSTAKVTSPNERADKYSSNQNIRNPTIFSSNKTDPKSTHVENTTTEFEKIPNRKIEDCTEKHQSRDLKNIIVKQNEDSNNETVNRTKTVTFVGVPDHVFEDCTQILQPQAGKSEIDKQRKFVNAKTVNFNEVANHVHENCTQKLQSQDVNSEIQIQEKSFTRTDNFDEIANHVFEDCTQKVQSQELKVVIDKQEKLLNTRTENFDKVANHIFERCTQKLQSQDSESKKDQEERLLNTETVNFYEFSNHVFEDSTQKLEPPVQFDEVANHVIEDSTQKLEPLVNFDEVANHVSEDSSQKLEPPNIERDSESLKKTNNESDAHMLDFKPSKNSTVKITVEMKNSAPSCNIFNTVFNAEKCGDIKEARDKHYENDIFNKMQPEKDNELSHSHNHEYHEFNQSEKSEHYKIYKNPDPETDQEKASIPAITEPKADLNINNKWLIDSDEMVVNDQPMKSNNVDLIKFSDITSVEFMKNQPINEIQTINDASHTQDEMRCNETHTNMDRNVFKTTVKRTIKIQLELETVTEQDIRDLVLGNIEESFQSCNFFGAVSQNKQENRIEEGVIISKENMPVDFEMIDFSGFQFQVNQPDADHNTHLITNNARNNVVYNDTLNALTQADTANSIREHCPYNDDTNKHKLENFLTSNDMKIENHAENVRNPKYQKRTEANIDLSVTNNVSENTLTQAYTTKSITEHCSHNGDTNRYMSGNFPINENMITENQIENAKNRKYQKRKETINDLSVPNNVSGTALTQANTANGITEHCFNNVDTNRYMSGNFPINENMITENQIENAKNRKYQKRKETINDLSVPNNVSGTALTQANTANGITEHCFNNIDTNRYMSGNFPINENMITENQIENARNPNYQKRKETINDLSVPNNVSGTALTQANTANGITEHCFNNVDTNRYMSGNFPINENMIIENAKNPKYLKRTETINVFSVPNNVSRTALRQANTANGDNCFNNVVTNSYMSGILPLNENMIIENHIENARSPKYQKRTETINDLSVTNNVSGTALTQANTANGITEHCFDNVDTNKYTSGNSPTAEDRVENARNCKHQTRTESISNSFLCDETPNNEKDKTLSGYNKTSDKNKNDDPPKADNYLRDVLCKYSYRLRVQCQPKSTNSFGRQTLANLNAELPATNSQNKTFKQENKTGMDSVIFEPNIKGIKKCDEILNMCFEANQQRKNHQNSNSAAQEKDYCYGKPQVTYSFDKANSKDNREDKCHNNEPNKDSENFNENLNMCSEEKQKSKSPLNSNNETQEISYNYGNVPKPTCSFDNAKRKDRMQEFKHRSFYQENSNKPSTSQIYERNNFFNHEDKCHNNQPNKNSGNFKENFNMCSEEKQRSKNAQNSNNATQQISYGYSNVLQPTCSFDNATRKEGMRENLNRSYLEWCNRPSTSHNQERNNYYIHEDKCHNNRNGFREILRDNSYNQDGNFHRKSKEQYSTEPNYGNLKQSNSLKDFYASEDQNMEYFQNAHNLIGPLRQPSTQSISFMDDALLNPMDFISKLQTNQTMSVNDSFSECLEMTTDRDMSGNDSFNENESLETTTQIHPEPRRKSTLKTINERELVKNRENKETLVLSNASYSDNVLSNASYSDNVLSKASYNVLSNASYSSNVHSNIYKNQRNKSERKSYNLDRFKFNKKTYKTAKIPLNPYPVYAFRNKKFKK